MNGGYLKGSNSERLEKYMRIQKRRQPGVAFPSAVKQEHVLVIRFNISLPISKSKDKEIVRRGVTRLCDFFERINNGKIKMDDLAEDGDLRLVPLSKFNFSATLGFGIGFFDKLGIDQKNRPKNLKEMPSHSFFGDPVPYLFRQTDFILQLGSDIEDVNRWVFQHCTTRCEKNEGTRRAYHPPNTKWGIHRHDEEDLDFCLLISDWASVTDVHVGFQRIDGRNLLGFNDGISNPRRLSNNIVWTTSVDENEKLTDGTYMVFQKIEHDLNRWRNLTTEKQEQWIGRSKGTGLLLGTLPRDQDQKLASELHSENPIVREGAKKRWKKLYDEQKDPERKFFDPNQRQYKEIQLQCPVWSHVRKSNPRQADGAARSLVFRRGYLFMEGGLNGVFNSGLLFICFQRNIEKGFEYIKKNFLNNKNFPVPDQRKKFSFQELKRRHQHGRFKGAELKNGVVGIFSTHYDSAVIISQDPKSQNTGREGLSGPSEMGAYPEGQMPITSTLGGGYYFIPPIPNRKISYLGEQFFV